MPPPPPESRSVSRRLGPAPPPGLDSPPDDAARFQQQTKLEILHVKHKLQHTTEDLGARVQTIVEDVDNLLERVKEELRKMNIDRDEHAKKQQVMEATVQSMALEINALVEKVGKLENK